MIVYKDEVTIGNRVVVSMKKQTYHGFVVLKINPLTIISETQKDLHPIEIEDNKNAIVELENVDIKKEIEDHAKLKEYLEQSSMLRSLRKELATVETIIKAIKGRPEFEQLIADAKEAFAKDNLVLPESSPLPGTGAWFRAFTNLGNY